MDNWGEHLAALAFFDAFVGVVFHGGSPVPMCDSSMGKRSAPRVTSAFPYMKSLEDSCDLARVSHEQVRTSKGLLVQFAFRAS